MSPEAPSAPSPETPIDWTPKARQVLQAASELFYAQGIHAVGVDGIAARAGVTKKTIYDRFGSKDRLVVEYLRGRDRPWRALVEERVAAAESQGPAAAVAAVFEASERHTRERGGLGCSMVKAYAEINEPGHPAYAVIMEEKRWLVDLFAALATTAGVPEPRAAALELTVLHEGAQVVHGLGLDTDAFDRARDAAVALVGRLVSRAG